MPVSAERSVIPVLPPRLLSDEVLQPSALTITKGHQARLAPAACHSSDQDAGRGDDANWLNVVVAGARGGANKPRDVSILNRVFLWVGFFFFFF